MVDSDARVSRRRRLWDRLATVAINLAGSAVIGLILLIFIYLVYIAVPLGQQAELGQLETVDLDAHGAYAVAGADARLYRLPGPGEGSTGTGVVAASGRVAVQAAGEELRLYALPSGADRVDVLTAKALGVVPVPGIRSGSLAVDVAGSSVLLAFYDRQNAIRILLLALRGGALREDLRWSIDRPALQGARLMPDLQSSRILALEGNRFLRIGLQRDAPLQLSAGALPGLLDAGAATFGWGPARETLLALTDAGQLHRFDTARVSMPRLGEVRETGLTPRWVGSERNRRVSYLLGEGGELLVLVPSSGDRLLRAGGTAMSGPGQVGIGGDGAFLYRLDERRFQRLALHNPFPETGWRSLWLPQWFGAYDAPAHSWHPDGGSIGVLSKFGLSPLLFGTFKAAILGMLMAVPLALGAAVYTGYLMPARQRNRIKPAIEMLEALPTVVLGFIAGLWAAPLLERHLFFVLSLALVLVLAPLLLSGAHLGLQMLSTRFVRRPPRMVPIAVSYVLAAALLLNYGEQLETRLFDATLADWMLREFGLRYDQRNGLLVGLAMGIAITPAMFSIVEDAIFAVPRSLSDGSLALGATRWQSLARIVLPAAAPAILSALLIGFARGLGETMIVLLATGNTPLLEANLFTGLRSLSASIAAELPEAGTGSVHFRVLFLAALVLFALTFTFNTVAELFRQRLRYSYANR